MSLNSQLFHEQTQRGFTSAQVLQGELGPYCEGLCAETPTPQLGCKVQGNLERRSGRTHGLAALVEIVELTEFSPYLLWNVISWDFKLEGKLHESGQ